MNMKSCGTFVVIVALSMAVFSSTVDIPELIVQAMPHIPGLYIVRTAYFLYILTSFYVIPTLKYFDLVEIEECFENPDDLKILISGVKGGTVFSYKLGFEIINICGITSAISMTESLGWPGMLFMPPEFEVDLFLAFAHTPSWQDYLKADFNKDKRLKCAVITRNPYDKLLSMYKYARDGGEQPLLQLSKELKKIESVEERFEHMWKVSGAPVMKLNHIPLMTAVEDYKCSQIDMNEFAKSSNHFDKEIEKMLDALGVRDVVKPKLLEAFAKHDLNRYSADQIAANTHISGKTLEPGEEEKVKQLIRKTEKVTKLLNSQCKDLGYHY